ncbi:MAG: hypothetical protein HRU36_02710 [Rickettsiales bacterium]|nr:hypothetical protein [Rickettsiales bacterium]
MNLTNMVKILHEQAIDVAKNNKLNKNETIKKMFNDGINFAGKSYKISDEGYKTSSDSKVKAIFKLLNGLDNSYFCTSSAAVDTKVDICKEDMDDEKVSDGVMTFMGEDADFDYFSSCPTIDHNGNLEHVGREYFVCKCEGQSFTCNTESLLGEITYKPFESGKDCSIVCAE